MPARCSRTPARVRLVLLMMLLLLMMMMMPMVVPTVFAEAAPRTELELPDTLWAAVLAAVEPARPVGYTEAEMGNYGRSLHLLPTVLRLFGDARSLPRFSGRLSSDLLAHADSAAAFGYGWSAGGLAEAALRCYGLLNVSAGRRTMPDTLASSTLDALDALAGEEWRALPRPLRDLTTRLYLAAEETRPWLAAAFDAELLAEIGRAAGTGDTSGLSVQISDLTRTARAPLTDERFDQLATPDARAFRLFDSVDLAYLGYASVLYLRHVEHALRAWRAEACDCSGVRPMRIATPAGEIVIGGAGDDDHTAPALLVIDVGGRDRYGAGLGAPQQLAAPVALVLDLAGDDRYEAAGDDPPPSFGAGLFGIGAVIDLAGNDLYTAGASALGCGCFGTGLLIDFGGDDQYLTHGPWTQGAAHAGIGMLLDLAGDDHYSCAEQSQGLGGTLGTGLLLDRAGNDRYVARDDGNVSALYLDQSVAMSQGCGYGRRADLGDGHSLAGGFGLLVDGAGDDDYHAQVWAQGCGYWWGIGLLEDRAGNDRYRNGKYSSGAAAHFAIGVHVDLGGDDEYNRGNTTAKNQYQGHARDGSIGLFIDGDGNDSYELRSHCAGSGDLGSIGLFWDRCGEDHYLWPAPLEGESGWADTPPLGSTTRYDPFRSFRDDLPVYGIFLDSGGRDTYEAQGVGANDSTWTQQRMPHAWGVGIDAAIYKP